MPQALIVDDNTDNLDVLAQLLALENVDVIIVNHPARLHDVLSGDTTFDVVFIDLEMPQNNGFEVLANLRQHPATDKAAMIAYTVHVSEIGAVRSGGFDGFIGKPVNADHFPRQLQNILAGNAVWSLP